MKEIFFILVLLLSIKSTAQISVNGQNFSNLIDARNYVRTINESMSSDIIVNISAGTYTLTETLEFTSEDSGTNGYKIIYQGTDLNNKPIINGGQQITGWTLHDASKNIWKANIGSLYSRQLYINEEKAQRSRSGNDFKLFESTSGYFSFCNNNDFQNWNLNQIEQRDLEVVSDNEWKSNRVPIQTKCGLQLTVNIPFWEKNHIGQFRCNNRPVWLENSFYLIDEPNEWYIDRSGSTNILYLKPLDGQNPNNLNVILPSLEMLIYGNNVNNLSFIDLVFKNTSWLGPSNYNTFLDSNNGLCVVQADWYYDIQNLTTTNGNIISSALRFVNSNQVNFYNNIFKNIGSIGLQFLQNCSNNIVCNNVFNQICASAITFGYSDYVNSDTSNSNLIKNNLIDTIGTEYKSSVAILIISAKNTIIKNNEIVNFPYTGISLGWGWGDGWCLPNTNCYNFGKNQILRNKIDCSGQKMSDGGAIYFLDSHGIDDNIINRTEVMENYIINYKMGSGAIYFDKGSRRINVTNNLIESTGTLTPSEGFVNFAGDFFWFTVSFEQAEDISFSDNYFSSNSYQTGALPSSEPTITESSNIPITIDNTQTLLIKNNAVRNLNCN